MFPIEEIFNLDDKSIVSEIEARGLCLPLQGDRAIILSWRAYILEAPTPSDMLLILTHYLNEQYINFGIYDTEDGTAPVTSLSVFVSRLPDNWHKDQPEVFEKIRGFIRERLYVPDKSGRFTDANDRRYIAAVCDMMHECAIELGKALGVRT